jgi:hypothetical protein
VEPQSLRFDPETEQVMGSSGLMKGSALSFYGDPVSRRNFVSKIDLTAT